MRFALGARLSEWKDALTTSLWFVPALMLIAATLLAQGAIYADEVMRAGPRGRIAWMLTTDERGARELLSIIASSMLGVAGVVFSVAVVVLSLAAGQLGPRLVRSHMQQRTTQVSLGLFTATFLYCLLVLMRVQDAVDSDYRAQISITLALVLAVACVCVLIYYIHHVAIFIQADSVIEDVSSQLRATLGRLLQPRDQGEAASEADAQRADSEEMPVRTAQLEICARGPGYVEQIDYGPLVELASEHDLRIELLKRPGHFVIEGAALALIDKDIDGEVEETIVEAIIIGPRPLPAHDVEFAIRQLVEVAVRALSPGINDPFTANACIDQLTEALGFALRRTFPRTRVYDDKHRLRLIRNVYTFADLLDASFNQIRQDARGKPAVAIRLLDSLAMLAPLAQREDDRAALLRHADMIVAGAADLPEPADADDLKQRHAELMHALAAASRARTRQPGQMRAA